MRGRRAGRKPPFWISACIVALVALTGCLGAEYPSEAPASEHQDDPALDELRSIEVTIDAVPCPEGYDNGFADDLCLAYNGQIPGPTWIFEHDERVEIELRHNVTESLEDADTLLDESVTSALTEARYTMHRHGLSLDACSDGVAKVKGSQICDSTVGPGEATTYTFKTPFPGYWHYHDHAHTFNGKPVYEPLLGEEGALRGLWGAYIVLEEGESREDVDHVFDLHVLDEGINGGLGLDETVQEGERFDIIAVGLGARSALDTVTLHDPDGNIVDEQLIGPGVSRGLSVTDAQAGTYTWTVETTGYSTDFMTEEHEGTITVKSANGESDQPQDASQMERAQAPNTDDEDDANVEPFDATRSLNDADRTFVINFDFTTADARAIAKDSAGIDPPSGFPLLEAYVGEELEFHVINPEGPFQHTFHLHGHPWEHPDTGEMIDTEPLEMGDTHSFTVTAGLDEGHAGDWLYHCHINADIPMWGILRVYENSMSAQGPLDELTVTVEDPDGAPVTDATITARWDANAPPDPFPATADRGQAVPVTVAEMNPGTYAVSPEILLEEAGELVIESTHEGETSLLRLMVNADGSYEQNRDVGIQAPPESDPLGLDALISNPMEDPPSLEGVA